MNLWRPFAFAGAIATLLAATAASAAEPILTKEPARGELHKGQSVLVDDGACKKGEIKRVCAGEGYGAPGSGVSDPRKRRTRTCVPRAK
jgi:Family of unknown function (DUF6719)